MSFRLALKPLDWVILLFSVALTVGLTTLLIVESGGEPSLVVETPEGAFLYPLDEDRVLDFEGPLGTTRLFIRDGHVGFESSPCTNQICVLAGTVETPGEWNACLPNRVFARVMGKVTPEEGVDALSF